MLGYVVLGNGLAGLVSRPAVLGPGWVVGVTAGARAESRRGGGRRDTIQGTLWAALEA